MSPLYVLGPAHAVGCACLPSQSRMSPSPQLRPGFMLSAHHAPWEANSRGRGISSLSEANLGYMRPSQKSFELSTKTQQLRPAWGRLDSSVPIPHPILSLQLCILGVLPAGHKRARGCVMDKCPVSEASASKASLTRVGVGVRGGGRGAPLSICFLVSIY